MIKKTIKIVLIIIVLGIVGNVYTEFELQNEEKAYLVIAISLPKSLDRSTMIKQFPASVCESRIEGAKQETIKNCANCIIHKSYCTSTLDRNYEDIFKDKPIKLKYVAFDFKYPERHIIRFSDNSLYGKYCDSMKQSYPGKVKCIF